MALPRLSNSPVAVNPINGLAYGREKLEDPIAKLGEKYPLLAYLDAEYSTFNLTSTSVDAWNDYRGNRNTIGGAGGCRTYTSTQRPTYGSRTYKGKYVVDWDGSDSLFNPGISTSTRAVTMFWVGVCDSASGGIIYSPNGTGALHFRINNDGSIQTAKSGTSVLLQTNSVHTAGTPYIMAQRVTSDEIYHYVNRVEYSGSNTTALTGGFTLQLGAEVTSSYFDGWWGAFVWFAQDIGRDNTYKVIDYLNSRWSIY